MFGVSFPELIVVLTIALLVFGPEKLPGLARELGSWSAKIKRHSDAFRREFYNAVYTPANDLQKQIRDEARTLVSTTPPSAALSVPTPEKNTEQKEETSPGKPGNNERTRQ